MKRCLTVSRNILTKPRMLGDVALKRAFGLYVGATDTQAEERKVGNLTDYE